MTAQPTRRLRITWDDEARSRIRGTQLVERLQDFVMTDDVDELEYDSPDDVLPRRKKKGEQPPRPPARSFNRKRMSSAQVTAALGLIKKILPDLAATQLSGDEESPVAVTEIRRTIVDPRRLDDA